MHSSNRHNNLDCYDSCLRLACPCAVYQDFRNPLKDYQLGYYDVIKNMVDSGRFEREDFTVVLQPFLMETKPLRLVSSCSCQRITFGAVYIIIIKYNVKSIFSYPQFNQNCCLKLQEDGTLDFGFFAVDCFHPSWRGHRILAFELWETMVHQRFKILTIL